MLDGRDDYSTWEVLMPCACGNAAAKREMLRVSRNTPSRDGGYGLSTYPGCTTLYTGPLEGESVYVAGRNTEDERLFKRVDLAAATEWVMANKLELENIPIVGLCGEAIEALFA